MTSYLHTKILESLQEIVSATELNGERVSYEVRNCVEQTGFNPFKQQKQTKTIITIEITN